MVFVVCVSCEILQFFVIYYTYDRLNMFRALLCPSSGAHNYSADYHMGRISCDHSTKNCKTSQLTQTTKTIIYINATSSIFTELDGLRGNQHYSHELLMMGIAVPETC